MTTLPDDVLTMLRLATAEAVRQDEIRRASSKGHLPDSAYSRVEMSVGDVRRLHEALEGVVR